MMTRHPPPVIMRPILRSRPLRGKRDADGAGNPGFGGGDAHEAFPRKATQVHLVVSN